MTPGKCGLRALHKEPATWGQCSQKWAIQEFPSNQKSSTAIKRQVVKVVIQEGSLTPLVDHGKIWGAPTKSYLTSWQVCFNREHAAFGNGHKGQNASATKSHFMICCIFVQLGGAFGPFFQGQTWFSLILLLLLNTILYQLTMSTKSWMFTWTNGWSNQLLMQEIDHLRWTGMGPCVFATNYQPQLG